ncbi:NADH-quinone oxidoreductase subunit E [Candidatus Westeberhardia cardiocondylae]|uniref:NADH-quinone oxidoreductase subunit E n=1 Tax=Candidatus Westeberhardia cardiocondylae TaxID=1594731 RepID=A0A0H5C5T2_9ENTR|nr:NADH-quinone oxidoreductase subunit NuoE [Candidatus Westeberhardia cardiocondylae]CEN32321.1 NADH-quinone oxidoreductase subunit E [Candidatus Westeberhardia cardiocondylae]
MNKKLFLDEQDKKIIEKEKKNYESPRAASIEVLKFIQKKYNWIPDELMNPIAKTLNMSSSELEEITTFYSQIFRKPVGKNIIRYCDSIVCYITGYEIIKKKIEFLLKIKPGQTTKNKKFTLLPTCCLGNCDKSPVIMINDNTYTNITPKKISLLLKKYK